WMKENNESIYGTSASPFPYELPWGYCTAKDEKLYLHVFNWPENGFIELNGLNNKIEKAYLMAEPEVGLIVKKGRENRVTIALPENPADDINSVIVLEISGIPDVDRFVVKQEGQESVILDFLTASTSGNAIKRFNRKGEQERFHISKMQAPDDVIEWQVDFEKPGNYDVLIKYAALPEWEGSTYVIDANGSQIMGSVKSSKGWYEYKTENLGALEIRKKGVNSVRLFPETNLEHYLMYFSSLELVKK
ncbi:MAG: hypothetical protein QNK35_08735, partial [Bacteroides sp.]|nr:hypothetical protein [Bacteroides sp.]